MYFSTLNVNVYNYKSISCCLSIMMHLYNAYYNLDNYNMHVRSTSYGHDGKN
jgi:NADH:ubiquinone oxidoreductase subunit B-like Fe-S oxidoreductase